MEIYINSNLSADLQIATAVNERKHVAFNVLCKDVKKTITNGCLLLILQKTSHGIFY